MHPFQFNGHMESEWPYFCSVHSWVTWPLPWCQLLDKCPLAEDLIVNREVHNSAKSHINTLKSQNCKLKSTKNSSFKAIKGRMGGSVKFPHIHTKDLILTTEWNVLLEGIAHVHRLDWPRFSTASIHFSSTSGADFSEGLNSSESSVSKEGSTPGGTVAAKPKPTNNISHYKSLYVASVVLKSFHCGQRQDLQVESLLQHTYMHAHSDTRTQQVTSTVTRMKQAKVLGLRRDTSPFQHILLRDWLLILFTTLHLSPTFSLCEVTDVYLGSSCPQYNTQQDSATRSSI